MFQKSSKQRTIKEEPLELFITEINKTSHAIRTHSDRQTNTSHNVLTVLLYIFTKSTEKGSEGNFVVPFYENSI